ncbi:MAG TPA: hypothetical protein VGB24_23755 [Longimicrobium sp.]|jgi:asparagine synthetase B (glutamine-hydrolysing)|uniref:hypothetical protein n=1 Tax=Longimicrobium sp. TaxID=2029185 RepID=UPI002EDAC3C9
MSDFLFSTRQRPPGELQSALVRYLSHVSVSIDEWHGPWGSLAVARGHHDPVDVLVEGDGWLSVLVGEPVVHGEGEPSARSRVGDRRRAVHRLLKSEPRHAWERSIDSGFAALAIDAAGGGMVLTDIASFVPVFVARVADGELVIGTHVDAVARVAERGRDIDPVSAADLAINLTCTFPNTLYRGVEQFPPATARGFGPDGAWDEEHAYWRPVERSAYRTTDQAAEALRTAVVSDVLATCEGAAEVGLLLSGGEDARAVLGAVPADVPVRAFVYADWRNREVKVAQAVARAYGAACTFGPREPDHYVNGLEPVARMIGGHNNFMDVHGWGFHERLGIRDLPVVLGGLSSDSFLKAEHAPDTAFNVDRFELPNAEVIRPELRDAVIERRLQFRRWLAEFRPKTATEWEKLWPFTQRKHSANVHGNRRLFAAHEVYHAVTVVTLAASVPQEWKYNRKLFHAAMKPLFRRSWYVPHSRWRFPFFGYAANLPLSAGLRITRGVRALATGQVRARHQPWPKWRTVARSPAAERIQRERPAWETPLRDIFADAPGDELQAGVRQWHPLRELMLMQLAYLAQQAAE